MATRTNTTTYEHPAFTRAKTLPDHLVGMFPRSREEAETFEPTVRCHALSSRVLVVACTRIECAWAAYCDAVPGQNHRNEVGAVLDHGAKVDEPVARILFPEFDAVPYAD